MMLRRLPLALAALAALSCSRSTPKSDPAPAASATATPAATQSAAVQVASAAPAASSAAPLPPPICKTEWRKVWASGADRLTGLTEAELPDGRVALGLAIGVQPAVLLMSDKAEGKLVKVPLKPGTHLAAYPKASEGHRHIQRVTPVRVEGDDVKVFVDFRDDFNDKRRLVACGPSESDDWWVAFNDTSYLDRKDPTEEEKKAAFKNDQYHEVRDCRTFADIARGETWIIGSGLHGKLGAEGVIEWETTLFVNTGTKNHDRHLHAYPLKGDKPKPVDYEVPVSRRLADGSFVLAVRSGGRLLVGLLGPDKSLKGQLVSYAGFPTIPDMADDGDDVIVSTSIAKGKGEYGIKALRINGKNPVLPKAYTNVVTDQETESDTDPDFIRDVKGQHWLAHVEGERGKGRLEIAPIDENLKLIGRPYAVTGEDEKVSSARLMAMKDGGILAAYIRDTGELVTEEVHCRIEK